MSNFLDSLLDDECMNVVDTSSRRGGGRGGRAGANSESRRQGMEGYHAPSSMESPGSRPSSRGGGRGGRGGGRSEVGARTPRSTQSNTLDSVTMERQSPGTTGPDTPQSYPSAEREVSRPFNRGGGRGGRSTRPLTGSPEGPLATPQTGPSVPFQRGTKGFSTPHPPSNRGGDREPRGDTQPQQPGTKGSKAVTPMTEEERSMMQRRPDRSTASTTQQPTETETVPVPVSHSASSVATPPSLSPNDEMNQAASASVSATTPSVKPEGEAAEPMRRMKGRSVIRKRVIDDPAEALKRDMINNLNKLTVENFSKICAVILGIVSTISTKALLELAVRLILDKSVTEISSIEVYVDLLHVVSFETCEFDDISGNLIKGTSGSSKAQKDFRNMLATLGNELAGRIPPVLELTEDETARLSPEERGEAMLKRRMNVIGIVKALTSLMIRTLIKPSFWKNMMRRLTFSPDGMSAPSDHLIEAACESIKVCGLYLDTIDLENEKRKKENPETPDLAEYIHFSAACKHLKQTIWRFEALVEFEIPARVECIIKDILDAKSHKWFYKTHREKAKALADIREDHKRSKVVGGAHVAAQYGTVEQMGVRANLMNPEYKTYYLSKTRNPEFTILVEGAPSLGLVPEEEER